MPSDESEIVAAELWECGSTGIVDEGRVLRAFFDADADVAALLARFARFAPRRTDHAPRDWVAESRATWEPFAAGDRFWLVPEWRDDPAPPGRVRVPVNPGLACGTGAHEATRLCLRAIERHKAGGVIADIGCGSGILSMAACLGGVADRAIACDLDATAAAIARENFAATGIDGAVFAGSAAAIAANAASIAVANISAAAAIRLLPDLLRIAPVAVVSGFEAESMEEVAEHARVIDTLAENAWRALVISRT